LDLYFHIFKLLKYLKFKKSEKRNAIKSEPTLKKKNYVNLNRNRNIKSKTEKQLELSGFSFSLPPKDLLSKSNIIKNKNKELDKINMDAAVKLEKTLSDIWC